MTTALAVIETDKLAKLLRLVFGSDQPGEVVAAVEAVKRLLSASDLDHHWLVGRLAHQQIDDAPRIDTDDDDAADRGAVWFAYHRRHWLTPRDRQFIEALTKWRGPLSTKQRRWLIDIYDKLAEVAA